MMNTINTELSFVEVWFTDQVSKPLEMGKLKEKTKKSRTNLHSSRKKITNNRLP